MSLEEQIKEYHALGRKIVELERQKKELGQLILQQMSQKVCSIAGFVARRYERLSIKTSIDEARAVHATKTEEVLDKDRLKELHQSGQMIPGISLIQYVHVSAAKVL